MGFSIGSIGYHYAAWRLPEASPDGGLSGRHYIESAQLAEQGKFDFVFIADVMSIRNFDDRRIAREREHALLKLEPTLALAAIAATTERIGLIPSVSTTYNPPYAFARRMASLDHISGGRAGWNMVTSFSLDEARNFSLDEPLDTATRHARAVEFVEVAKGLWDSWDDDAFVRDKASGIYFHRDRFHFLEHKGEFFEVRGPLDTARPPQGCLPIITAGSSEQSQELAARIADMVYAGQPDIDSARRYYNSVKRRLAKYERDWDSLMMMPGIMPFVGRTQQEAEDKFARLQSLLHPSVGIGMLIINHFPDLTGYDLDSPVPEIAMTNDQMGSGPEDQRAGAGVYLGTDGSGAAREADDTAIVRRDLGWLLVARCDRHAGEGCRSDGGVVHHRCGGRVQCATTGFARCRQGFRRAGDPGIAAPRAVPS